MDGPWTSCWHVLQSLVAETEAAIAEAAEIAKAHAVKASTAAVAAAAARNGN